MSLEQSRKELSERERMICVVHLISGLVFLVDRALSLLHEVAHAVSKLVLGWVQEHKNAVDQLERAQANLAELAHSLVLVLVGLFVVRAKHHDKVVQYAVVMNELKERHCLRVDRQVLIEHVLR